VLGGRARLVLNHPHVEEVLTTDANQAEVEEYALLLAEKKRLRGDLLLLAVASLPITVVERSEYSMSLPQARRRIGLPDPDDAELLALALHHKIPIRSNDHDFEKLRVELFATEDLLRHLGIID
jgi:predicted nucleic acid-binding protein